MKKTFILTLTASAVAALTLGASAFAEHPKGTGEKCDAANTMRAEQLAKYDADGNGKLSDSEKLAIKMAHFNEIDTNGNGSLTHTELSAAFEKRKEERKAKMQAKHFELIDTNNDGNISVEEFASADKGSKGDRGSKNGKRKGEDGDRRSRKEMHQSILENFDADGDGKLSDIEKQTAHSSKFAAADANSDGNLTSAELEAFHTAEKERMKSVLQTKHFEKLDADKDGVVNFDEFNANKERGSHDDKDHGKKHRNDC